jgi:hypothetical protein
VQGVGIRDVDVDDTTGRSGFLHVVGDQVQLDASAFDEAVLGGLVEFRLEAESLIAGECSVEIPHGQDGSDAFEDNLGHARNASCHPRWARRRASTDIGCHLVRAVTTVASALSVLARQFDE